MKVVELVDYKVKRKSSKESTISSPPKKKNHAELLSEAFNALDKFNAKHY